jgi:hypothetical protein
MNRRPKVAGMAAGRRVVDHDRLKVNAHGLYLFVFSHDLTQKCLNFLSHALAI